MAALDSSPSGRLRLVSSIQLHRHAQVSALLIAASGQQMSWACRWWEVCLADRAADARSVSHNDEGFLLGLTRLTGLSK